MFNKLHPVIQTLAVIWKGLRCDWRFRDQTRSDADLLLACSAAQRGLKGRKQTDNLFGFQEALQGLEVSSDILHHLLLLYYIIYITVQLNKVGKQLINHCHVSNIHPSFSSMFGLHQHLRKYLLCLSAVQWSAGRSVIFSVITERGFPVAAAWMRVMKQSELNAA